MRAIGRDLSAREAYEGRRRATRVAVSSIRLRYAASVRDGRHAALSLVSRSAGSTDIGKRAARGSHPGRLFLWPGPGYRLAPAGSKAPAGAARSPASGNPPSMAITPLMPVYPRSPVRPVRGRRGLSVWRAGREISRFRGGDRGQSARPRPSASDQGDPGPGGDADPRVQPLRQPAGRGVRAAAGRPDLRRHRVLHQFGRRGGRVRDQDRAPLSPRQGQSAQERADHLHQRLPRADDGDDQRDRPGQAARRLRAAARRASRWCAFDDLDAALAAVDDSTAGFLLEPVQGEGGIRPASREFIAGLRAASATRRI